MSATGPALISSLASMKTTTFSPASSHLARAILKSSTMALRGSLGLPFSLK